MPVHLPISRTILFLLLVLTGRMLFADSWPLGTLKTAGEARTECPAGFSCQAFEIACPKVDKTGDGFLATAPALGKARGMVVFFTGGFGRDWWIDENPSNVTFIEELRKLGIAVAQVQWKDGWFVSPQGSNSGVAHLACRPATVIRYIYDHIYVPLQINNKEIGRTGFCITGNSGGASQVSYALSHYGLEDILNVVIPTGGPPHAAMDRACLGEFDLKRKQGTVLPTQMRQLIDRGFGFFKKAGPCATQDTSFRERWLEESVATGGNDYSHPKTRIQFLIGQKDGKMQAIGRVYYDRLRKEGSPHVSWEVVSGTPHQIASTPDGRAALKRAILGSANGS